jgi:hypothetical protein
MKRYFAALLVLFPAIAVAQPYDPPPSPPPSGYPPPPPQPQPPPPGYGQPPPPGYGPGYVQPRPMRSGLTFEANIGLGFIWARNEGRDSDTEGALAGLNLGLGGWLNDRMAVTGRIAGATFSPSDGVRFTQGFAGPSLQYWTDDHVWVGAGVGLGFARITVDGFGSDSETGFALDLRAGYTFSQNTESTWNVSIEYTPAFFEVDGRSLQINSFGILFGYQHL